MDQALKRLLLRAHDGFLALVAPGLIWRGESSPELPAVARRADLVWEVESRHGQHRLLHIEPRVRAGAPEKPAGHEGAALICYATPMTDPIVVVDYDLAWPALFAALHAPVAAALQEITVAIEHVGSTAVPGLTAKPIIDLNVALRTEADLPEAIERLARLGSAYEGDKGIPGRAAFAGRRRRCGTICTFMRWTAWSTVVTCSSADHAQQCSFRARA